MRRLGGYFSENRVENAPRIDTNEHELSTNFLPQRHRGGRGLLGKQEGRNLTSHELHELTRIF
jgi:hypothetical protein